MKLKTTRMIDSDKVRAMCIKNDYCTRATISEYASILNYCQGAVDDADIALITQRIADTTNLDKIMNSASVSVREAIESIAFNLVNDCTYTAVEMI